MATRRTTGSPPRTRTTAARRKSGAAPARGAGEGRRARSRRLHLASWSPKTPRRAMIAEAAYLRAERRGFATGNEEEDWLAAEAEVDALLRAGAPAKPPAVVVDGR